jgi:Glycosyl hydrolases family 18
MSDSPIAMGYWAAWNNPAIPNLYFRLSMAFALLEGDGSSGNPYWTNYAPSGNFQQPAGPGSTYYTWNQWLLAHGNGSEGAITLVSYGGSTDQNIRAVIIANSYLDNLAGEIAANLAKYYFGGVDLDIEEWWNYSQAQNQTFAVNLAGMIKVLGPVVPSWKPITIAVGAQSAGSLAAIGVPDDNYTGTMQAFYADATAMSYVNQINIMSYNLPIDDLYGNLNDIQAILNTYTQAGVPASKLSIGIQPVQASGQQPVSLDTVTELCTWLKQNGYGGAFLWGIGDAAMPSTPTASDYMTAIVNGLGYPQGTG